MELAQKLKKLERLANKLNCIIKYGSRNAYIKNKNRIIVNSRQKPLKRLWVIAHELGHALTLDQCIHNFGLRAATGAHHTWPSTESEVQAWHEADKIIKKLKLYTVDYLKFKHECLRSYYFASRG